MKTLRMCLLDIVEKAVFSIFVVLFSNTLEGKGHCGGQTKEFVRRSIDNRSDKNGSCLLCFRRIVDTENVINRFSLFRIRVIDVSLSIAMPWRTRHC